ncbi:carboxypeptidase regulatory-like domain-containing protein [Aquabacterium sp.]|uniref:carboxypeptidase regulatory-like domain-containing protein n=1 Tax=Aquabacterium sp. TaxID=1872578 RepID=UPI001999C2F9|nr:carboxypeptidase regulatory-like domain-containing protein [Aquabacterium sp.]MBC7701127.1 carboxypeptidase regulatory-like domain-containing protein [Aquabacterium sp.]
MTARLQTRWIAGLTGWALMLATAQACGAEHAALPAEKTSHGISYLSGGVGLDESTALKAARKDYSLDIETFQSANGKNEYTAAVPLTVTRSNGEVVFEAPTDGPFTLLRLPPGTYVVKASHQGQTQQRQVQVGTGLGAKASFVFKPGS